jgi:hypothetical protein
VTKPEMGYCQTNQNWLNLTLRRRRSTGLSENARRDLGAQNGTFVAFCSTLIR